jgi:hypothetical protein
LSNFLLEKQAPIGRDSVLDAVTPTSGGGRETSPTGACIMSLPDSVADVIQRHVTLTVECLDRLYLNVIQPRLQVESGIAYFFRQHRGELFATAKTMADITRPFVAAIEQFAQTHGLDLIPFGRRQRKDDVAREYLAKFNAPEGILFVGKAQERAAVVRTISQKNPRTGRSYPWLQKSTSMVNHYYFYGVDEDFGPFFIKFCSYFPCNAKLCLNGHEYVKRQLAKEGIAFEALDNGIRSCADPKRLQEICNSLTPAKIQAFWQKWAKRLPHPFPAKDRAAGFRYQLFIQQAEFARTQVFDRPLSGRLFFEQVLRDNLDLGRPEHMQLIFDRRIPHNTKTRFRTRLVTHHVIPSLWLDYKHSFLKQYFKEGRALRTELVVNHTRDFGIGKALDNLPRLRETAFAANRRLLHVQQLRHDPILGEDAFQTMTTPQTVAGQRVSGLRFGDPMVLAFFSALLLLRHVFRGFSNADLRHSLTPLLSCSANELKPGRITYHLRRLRLRGLIERIPKTHRYQVTETGWRTALFYVCSFTRVIRPTENDLNSPSIRARLLQELTDTIQRLMPDSQAA